MLLLLKKSITLLVVDGVPLLLPLETDDVDAPLLFFGVVEVLELKSETITEFLYCFLDASLAFFAKTLSSLLNILLCKSDSVFPLIIDVSLKLSSISPLWSMKLVEETFLWVSY